MRERIAHGPTYPLRDLRTPSLQSTRLERQLGWHRDVPEFESSSAFARRSLSYTFAELSGRKKGGARKAFAGLERDRLPDAGESALGWQHASPTKTMRIQ